MEDFALFRKGAAENHDELRVDETAFTSENRGTTVTRQLTMDSAYNNQPPGGNGGHGGTHRVNTDQLESAPSCFQRNTSFQSGEARQYLAEKNRPNDGRHGIDGNSSFQHRSNFPIRNDQYTSVSYPQSFRPIQQGGTGQKQLESTGNTYAAPPGQPKLPQPIFGTNVNAAIGNRHSMIRPTQERELSIYAINGAGPGAVSKDLEGRLGPQTSGINNLEQPASETNCGVSVQSHGTVETSKGSRQNVVLPNSFQNGRSAQMEMNGDENKRYSNYLDQNSRLQLGRNPQTAETRSREQPAAGVPSGFQQHRPVQVGMNGDESRKFPNHPDQSSKLLFGRNPQTAEATSTASRQQPAAGVPSGFQQYRPIQGGLNGSENLKYPNNPDQNSKLQFCRNPQTTESTSTKSRLQPPAGVPSGFQQYRPAQTGVMREDSRINMNGVKGNMSYQFGKNLPSGTAAATANRQQPTGGLSSFQPAGSVQTGTKRDENRNSVNPRDQNCNYQFGRNPEAAGPTATANNQTHVGVSSGLQYHGQVHADIMKDQSRNVIQSNSNSNNQFGRNPPIGGGVTVANRQQPAGNPSNFQHRGQAQMGIKNDQNQSSSNLPNESNMCRFGRNPQTSGVLFGTNRQQSGAVVSQFPGRVNLQVSSTFNSSGQGPARATADIRANPSVQCGREGNNVNAYGTAGAVLKSQHSTAAQSNFSTRERSMIGAVQPSVHNQSGAGPFAGSLRSYASTRVGNEGVQGKNVIESTNISSEPTSYFAQLNPVKAAAAGVVTARSFSKPPVAPTNPVNRPTVNIGISFSSRNQQQSGDPRDTR